MSRCDAELKGDLLPDPAFGHDPDPQWNDTFNKNQQNMANMQFVHSNSIDQLCLQKKIEDSLLHTTYALRVHPTTQVKASNQYHSGRCWMFAGLNLMRRELIHSLSLKPDFELSESYLFFWHLYEQFAYWLDIIGRRELLKNRPESHADVMASLIGDGGNFSDFRNLVRQYGILPKEFYSETYHSKSPRIMRWVLNNMLRKAILHLEKNPDDRSKPTFFKNQHYECFRLLCLCLGVPPARDKPFFFQYREYTPSQPVGGALKTHSVTPVAFYESLHTSGHFKQDGLVSLIHDPRRGRRGGWCTCEFECIKPEQDQRILYDVGSDGIDVMINAVIRSIRVNVGVWFACEVSENLSVRLEGMEKDLYDYESVLHCPDITMTKAERMKTWRTTPDHAMVIVGVDFKQGTCIETASAKDVTKFCVENSWSSSGRGHGYYSMGVEWFREYVFQVVVAKSSLSPHLQMPRKGNMHIYPLWDIF